MKKKNIKIIILIIVFLLICMLCFFVCEFSNKNEDSKTSNNQQESYMDSITQVQQEANSIEDSEMKDFVSITIDQYLDIYSGNENKIVLFSRPTCHYCQIAEPILKNISYKYNLEINNLNTDEFSDEDFTKLENSNSRFERFATPLLIVVSNNKIVDEVDGLTDTNRYLKFFKDYNFINE